MGAAVVFSSGRDIPLVDEAFVVMGAQRPFDFGERPLIVGLVPLLPADVAERLRKAEDPLGAALDLYHSHDLVRCAIEIATPDLASALDRGDAVRERALTRLLATILRMATRATPFGLHAGVGLVTCGDRTDLTIRWDSRRLHGRPDLGWLSDVARAALQDAVALDELTLVPNSLMLKRGDRLYLEHLGDASARSEANYTRTSVRLTPVVEAVVSAATGGATGSEIAFRVAQRCEIEKASATDHVRALVHAGVVVPWFQGNPLACDVDVTKEIERISPAMEPALASIRADLSDACENPSADAFRAVIGRARALCPSDRSPIQVDTVVRFEGTLSARVLDTVRLLGEIAIAIAPRFNDAGAYLRAFLHRYEGGERLVPLTRFVGVMEDEQLFREYAAPPVQTLAERASSRVLLRALSEVLRDRGQGCVLSDVDVEEMLRWSAGAELLPTFELAFHVAASSAEAIDRGEFLVVPARISGTPRAGASIARFGAAEPEFSDAIERFHRRAHDEDAVEVAFLPAIAWHRNVVGRRATTERTIEFGVGAPSSRALDFAQLFVTVRDEKLVIWSQELRRFVRPVETTAYGTHAYGPPLARFLRAVACDGAAQILPVRWPNEEALPFTPRLRYRNAVLAVATWRVPMNGVDGDAARWRRLSAFRSRWAVPREVVLVEGDNAIPIDLDSTAGEMLFLALTRANTEVTLQERLPSATDHWARSGAGVQVVEFFVSCRVARGRFRALNGDESFPPRLARGGADERWTYVRWFGAPADADRLTARVADLRDAVAEVAPVVNWHVLRYRSPRFHLRVRLCTDDPVAAQRVAMLFSQQLVREERIDAFEFAEYEPERERYGDLAMTAVERLFTRSSATAVNAFAGRLREERVVAAVAAFDGILGAALDPTEIERVIQTFRLRPRPLAEAERRAVRRLHDLGNAEPDDEARRAAVAFRVHAGRKVNSNLLVDAFADFAHLHFNRYGLAGAAERSAFYVLWHVLRARLLTPREVAICTPSS